MDRAMTIAHGKTLILSTMVAVLIGSCGGGSGSGGAGLAPPQPVGGIGRLGIAFGTISTFGSVVVNGVRYETGTAIITIDDAAGTEANLRVGEVVLVTGTIDDNLTTGTADEVIYDDNVEGPIESIDTTLGQLVLLGQLVVVSPDTSFDDSISPASLDGLMVGDIVEVSGFIAADGSIAATRIEKKPAGIQFEVHGTVSNLDTAALLFSINALVVDYSGATIDDFPGGQITDGDFVEAKGMSLGANGELIATQVELESITVTGDAGVRVEVEGLITRFVTPQDFDVAGTPVTTDGGTVFEGGVAADLGLNIKVEVEGDLDANGVIVADKVDIRRAKLIRAEALVDSVNAGGNSLVVLGITFNVDALTRFEDKSSADVKPLTIANINAGDYLELRGTEIPAGSGGVLVTILEREDVDPDTILQGFVETVSDPVLTILGVTIDTNGATVFRDDDDSVLTAAEFFNRVDVNSLVKATGVESSATTITASEVEFEFEN